MVCTLVALTSLALAFASPAPPAVAVRGVSKVYPGGRVGVPLRFVGGPGPAFVVCDRAVHLDAATVVRLLRDRAEARREGLRYNPAAYAVYWLSDEVGYAPSATADNGIIELVPARRGGALDVEVFLPGTRVPALGGRVILFAVSGDWQVSCAAVAAVRP